MTITYSPAEVIARLLVELGNGVDPDDYSQSGSATQWPIYDANEPDLPDNCITVFDTSPVSDGRSMIDGETFDHFGIQIKIRSKDHRTGWTKANLLHESISKSVYQESITISGVAYLVHCISRISNVLVLGKSDEKTNRRMFTLNALVSLKQV